MIAPSRLLRSFVLFIPSRSAPLVRPVTLSKMLSAKSLFTLLVLSSASLADPSVPLKRQAGPEDPSASALTRVIPSPGAAPIPITKQYQALTSYVPILTVCPAAVYPTAAAAVINGSSSPVSACNTSYSPTVTTVCYTELPALISKATVTSCNQAITFSERLGYVIPTQSTLNQAAEASIATLTTYMVAPWQQLTAATPPSTSVTARVCNGDLTSSLTCTDSVVEPRSAVVTGTTTSTLPLKINANVQGPAKVIVPSTSFDVGPSQTTINLDTSYVTEQPIASTKVSYVAQMQGGSPITSSVAPAGGSATPLIGSTPAIGNVYTSGGSSQGPEVPESYSGSMFSGSITALMPSSVATTLSSEISTSTRTVTVNVTISTGSIG